MLFSKQLSRTAEKQIRLARPPATHVYEIQNQFANVNRADVGRDRFPSSVMAQMRQDDPGGPRASRKKQATTDRLL
jgi:hypothetical protein